MTAAGWVQRHLLVRSITVHKSFLSPATVPLEVQRFAIYLEESRSLQYQETH